MNIGRLRERVRIVIASSSADSAGDLGHPTWSELATVWAEVQPLSARERWAAAQAEAQVQYRVRMRYRDDVTPAAQLVCLGPDYATSTMQIQSVVKFHRAGYLELDCSEVVD